MPTTVVGPVFFLWTNAFWQCYGLWLGGINLIDRKELNIEKEVQRTAFYTDGTFHCSWRCTSDDVIKQEFESQLLKETVQLQLSRALLAYLSTATVAFISCLGLHFSGLSIRDVTERATLSHFLAGCRNHVL